MRIKGTRKFGRKRYNLIWDSETFDAPNTKVAIREKKNIANLYASDYRGRGYNIRITSSGDNFKVWGLPK